MKRHIPNIITLGNLLCGSLAVYIAIQGNIRDAAALILLGAILDFFDGLVARLLNVSNELGMQLDSLADLITFGLAPTFIAFHVLKEALVDQPMSIPFIEYMPFLIVLLSAMRLAKFNIDERQVEDFIGMPTPANALLWLSIGLSCFYFPEGMIANIFDNPGIVIMTIIVFSIVMVVELPVFSLKLKSLGFRGNEWKIILLIISIILLIFLSIEAVPLIIILYLILSLIKNVLAKPDDKKYIA
ncbi:MAG: CDP-diacylglycerol--serine O-phosphatidyltransferase [Patiriisocius sp.]|jgi:CDP-diacylglycerol--serine O-phosphatidyltransferase